ncbi:cytolysin [Fomes fomentarius]|nr:cytolysin [Fomes fomentarius]
MSSTKTSWEDLSRLGWPINEVYKKANAKRGGTMNGLGDIFLNSGIAADYQWWSYNTTIGSPYVLSRIPNEITREETAWSYDNRQNSQPFSDNWSESWSNSRSATLTVSSGLTISMSTSITIFDVASSGFDISINLATSTTETKETSYNLSHSWPLEVGPHEKLTLVRVVTSSSEIAEYGQDFGLTSGSLLGSKYNDHYYWGYNINSILNSPRGRLALQGSSRSITYNFKLVREGPNGARTEPLPVDMSDAVSNTGERPPAAIIKKWADEATLAVGNERIDDTVLGDQ